jgi:ABC-type Fe3+-siderophore transport system permease subunit
MSNLILQALGLLSLFLGFITASFSAAIYISIRRLGGSLERRHALVLTAVALSFLLGAVILMILASIF